MTFRAGLCLLLLSLCSCHRGGLPSRIEKVPSDLANPELAVSGIYKDGWMEDTASLLLQQPDDMHGLIVRGMIPKIADAPFSSEVELRLDEQVVATR
jgi:hypothetical protein